MTVIVLPITDDRYCHSEERSDEGICYIMMLPILSAVVVLFS
jgi:hypothetical protein